MYINSKHFLKKIPIIQIIKIILTVIINKKLNMENYHSNFVQIIKININIKRIKTINDDLNIIVLFVWI